jgi:hypothetical protein
VPDVTSAAELRASYAAWRAELEGKQEKLTVPLIGLLMARTVCNTLGSAESGFEDEPLTCTSKMERVTRIELALSAWEADVLPLNYTRVRPHRMTIPLAWAVSAQTSYRTR